MTCRLCPKYRGPQASNRHKVVLGLAPAAALPSVALAADILKANKITCTMQQMLECTDGKCKGTPTDDAQKAETMTFDFKVKKGWVKKCRQQKPFGQIADIKIEGDIRSFRFGEGKNNMIKTTLDKTGKLIAFMGPMGKQEMRSEATCVAV